MGIQGLLPTLKSIMNPLHVRDYAGKRAAVDTYSWLHKAAFSCSKDICLGRPNNKYIDYCMHRVKMLRHYGVQPVLVFDGGSLPMKSDQEIKRARSRKENLDRALEHEREGNLSAAYECFQKAVDITPAIAFRLIQVLRLENVDYVVAPYEADAQMAFLARNGHVDLVITEDSDLIAYACPQILFKMDKYGQGVGFRFADIAVSKDIDFNNFSKQMILEMCILSGCDYLSSLPGMGVKKAHGLIKRFKTYEKVMKHLKFSGVLIDKQYEQGFHRSILTFQHHRVYDPAKMEMTHLTNLPSDLDSDLDFLGPFLSQTVAVAIARGEVDPTTYEPFEVMSSSQMLGTALKAKACRGSPNMGAERSPQRTVLITNFLQKPGESRKEQCRLLSNIPDSALLHSQWSQEETAFQLTPSPTITSQTYSSPFSKFSFASQQSSVFSTPPSQVSPFVSENLDLNEGLPRIIDLTSDYPPPEQPLEKAHSFSGEMQKGESPFHSRISLSKPVEAKASKTSASLIVQNAAAQLTCAKQLRAGVPCLGGPGRRSAYFSQSLPPLLPACPGVSEEVHHKRNADVSEDSFPSIQPDAQISEGFEIECDIRRVNDVQCFSDVKKETLKDITNNGKARAITAGKRKHAPNFRSALIGEKPRKSRAFSSLSHVSEYGGLAQRSMDDFVSTLVPFRSSKACSDESGLPAPTKEGTRPSGLRAPSKSAQRTSSTRALTAGLTRKISDFVLSSPVKLPRLTFPESTSTAGSAAVSWQVYNEADWERA